MGKYRIKRRAYPKVRGDGSEGFSSRKELIVEIARNGIGRGAKHIAHADGGKGGNKQLTKDELLVLLKDVASFMRQNSN